jgi:hypothetical protein
VRCFLNLGKCGKFVYRHTSMSPPILFYFCELGWGAFGEFYEHLWICVNRNRNIDFLKIKNKHSGRFKEIERTHIGVIVFSYCVIVLIFGMNFMNLNRQNWSMNHVNDINLGKLKGPMLT